MTGFIVATVLSAVILLAALIISACIKKRPYRSSRLITPLRAFAAGVFVSGFVLFFPHYFTMFSQQPFAAQLWETIWVSVHHTVRLFIIDTGFEEIFSSAIANGIVAYAIMGTILFILAPVMTAGVILSFFRNFVSYATCFIHRQRDAYIFSELNERSLAFASDLRKNHKKAILIFTDVFGGDDEESYELGERARALGALCFRTDIATLNLKFFSKSSKLYFFAIGEDERENVRQAFSLVDPKGPYANRENVQLDVFSTGVEGELLLSNLPDTKIHLRRVDDIRSLVLRNITDLGKELFERAIVTENGEKLIRALVVGAGGHGREMLKALAWCCQMAGYRIEIHAFDVNPHAEDEFTILAPELMSKEKNGKDIPGESHYTIVFHDGISVNDARFTRALDEIDVPTSIFVSLGDDAQAVRTAVYLRQYFRQRHMPDPLIQAIVYDNQNREVLNAAKNFKSKPYDIKFIGAREDMYSERVLLRPELEEEALETHKAYGGTEENFYHVRYDYNYRSTIATTFHRQLRRDLNIANSACKSASELTEEERDLLEITEHKRWTVYLRTEGYVYSGSDDASTRDDLAKMHHNLIPYERLSPEDKRKDSTVAIGKK